MVYNYLDSNGLGLVHDVNFLAVLFMTNKLCRINK